MGALVKRLLLLAASRNMDRHIQKLEPRYGILQVKKDIEQSQMHIIETLLELYWSTT